MPVVHKDGEIERHNAYHRLNPSGHEEFVIKRDGKEEETLNELADDVASLLEYMEFGGPMPAMSPEQPPNDRALNQSPELVASRGDQLRNNDETITNMTGSTQLASDSPELSRVKSKLQATAVGNKVRNKYITGSSGDGIDYGATHSESFTGTAGIAIAPTQYEVIGGDDDDDDDNDDESKQVSENSMKKNIDDLLLEWEPEFKAGEYSPGDYQMVSPSGDGVAKRKPKQDRVGAYDTDTTEAGKPFPGKHKDTAAMCDVDEDGVEGKPQGGHESKHGDPTDGHQTKLSHNWPNKPKNSGGGVAEPFGGTRWSDGGTLEGGSGQDDEHYTKGSPGLPKEGPITGTKGAQMGQPMEWSPEKIGQLLGEDANIQELFDSYARSTDQVYLEGFQELCDAHGLDVTLDESSLLHLMASNQEFMFHEHNDSLGTYWLAESAAAYGSINEGVISELQIRSPEEEAGLYVDRMPAGDPDGGIPASAIGMPGRSEMFSDDNAEYDDNLQSGQEQMNRFGPGPIGADPVGDEVDEFGNDDFGDDEFGGQCPGCGYTGMEDECPECGQLMMQREEDIPGNVPQEEAAGMGDELDLGGELGGGGGPGGRGRNFGPQESREIITGPRINESLGRFMASARSIIENSRGISKKEIAETLNHSWKFYAGNINARSTPTKVRNTLQQMMESFPGFNPLLREAGSDVMGAATGKAITSGGMKQSPHLTKQPGPDEMEQHGSKDNPLKRDQKNCYKNTPIMKGTEKGLTGTGKVKEESKLRGPNAAILRDNVNILAKRIRNSIRESAKALGSGKHTVSFSIMVSEGDSKTRTPTRSQLVEAVADLEEVLQFHSVDDVAFETKFKDAKGHVILKNDVPLATINPRGPLMAEGKAIFRFKRNAELFANELVAEGKTCRIQPHNWGSAVSAKAINENANTAFKTLRKRKDR